LILLFSERVLLLNAQCSHSASNMSGKDVNPKVDGVW